MSFIVKSSSVQVHDTKSHQLPKVMWRCVKHVPRMMLRVPILTYRYTLSAFMGRQCRYLPTCSEFADTAITAHGAWAGGWMAAGRICRCHPWGGSGFEAVPVELPPDAVWYMPWRYARRPSSWMRDGRI